MTSKYRYNTPKHPKWRLSDNNIAMHIFYFNMKFDKKQAIITVDGHEYFTWHKAISKIEKQSTQSNFFAYTPSTSCSAKDASKSNGQKRQQNHDAKNRRNRRSGNVAKIKKTHTVTISWQDE